MKNHSFNFEGGDILSKIGAAWFVSRAYFEYVDNSHLNWKTAKLTENSHKSRNSKFINSKKYHLIWLNEVLSMNNLDAHKNMVNLKSLKIKNMASKIIEKNI